MNVQDTSLPIVEASDHLLEHLFARQTAMCRTVGRSTAAERVKKLTRLRESLMERRDELKSAMSRDFRKCAEEVDLTEVVPVLMEIKHAARHLERWMRPKKVRMPIPLFGTASEIHYQPRGVALIISPWNYPVNLTIGPLVSAVAAGNCSILKPSEFTPHTAQVIKNIVGDCFDESECAVVLGDRGVAAALLRLPFDHVFFTGSPRVGSIVMKAAAEHLSSVTLELGGKSPGIVTPSADVDGAARAIAWGKFSNAGQACVAPDFVVVHDSIADKLLNSLQQALAELSSTASLESSPDFARIVDRRHFDRINRLIRDAIDHGARILVGGQRDRDHNYMAPTVLTRVTWTSPIMSEEIFGPLLPVLTYADTDDMLRRLDALPPPLALYIFADAETADSILPQTRSGGVVINDVGIHFVNPDLPFGGLRTSGIGRSHGHAGFLAFSNERGVMRQRMRRPPTTAFYPPYTDKTRKLIDWLLRLVG